LFLFFCFFLFFVQSFPRRDTFFSFFPLFSPVRIFVCPTVGGGGSVHGHVLPISGGWMGLDIIPSLLTPPPPPPCCLRLISWYGSFSPSYLSIYTYIYIHSSHMPRIELSGFFTENRVLARHQNGLSNHDLDLSEIWNGTRDRC
jgi:hypothetical protein